MYLNLSILSIAVFAFLGTGPLTPAPPNEESAATRNGDQQDEASMNPNELASFERLVGGRWVADDGTYAMYTWGLGNLSIRQEMYFLIEGDPVLVSEGLWFWHPGEEKVKGYTTAIEMPVHFFDYETWWEGDTMVSRLVSYGEMGGEYRETWEFTDEDTYVWSLFQGPEGAEQQVMGGTWHRMPLVGAGER